MTYVQPCADPENDPEDWFISRDGKQYPDDPMPGYSGETVSAAWDVAIEELGRDITDAEMKRIDDRVYDDSQRSQLRKRRHAKEACHECYFRMGCLDQALKPDTPATHGTWGGYYEEELREIRREIDRRKRARRGSI
jgi:hypothetical protein